MSSATPQADPGLPDTDLPQYRAPRIRGWIALACCLVLVMAINALSRATEEPVRWRLGTPRSVISATRWDVSVQPALMARTVVPRAGAQPRETPRTFLVVEWKASVKVRDAVLRVQLRTDDDVVYSERKEFRSGRPGVTPPGFTVTGTSVSTCQSTA